MENQRSNPTYNIHHKWATPHARQALMSWSRTKQLVKAGFITVDGESLDIASLVHGCYMILKSDTAINDRIDASVETPQGYLSKGYYLYGKSITTASDLNFACNSIGFNTGFGGSAENRTKDVLGLQRSFMQHTQSAIFTTEDKKDTPSTHEYLGSHSMPTSWVRATILLRCNTNIGGRSAMTYSVIDAILRLIKHDITPVVLLRGSISASDVYVRVGGKWGSPKIKTACQALKDVSIGPVVLGPKEGLSLINGIIASAAVASLALYEANQLAVVSQFLTALTSEALYTNDEWAHPFIAAVRPHQGKIKAAQNIRTVLQGSRLSYGLEPLQSWSASGAICFAEFASMARTPTELNSTSDNPVVNFADNDIHCGANFQAASVTSVVEKTRIALQSIGKILFSQTSEMINHDLSNCLPPNLVADDPSLPFCLKGIDVNTAAYMSELAFIANPVSNHVQSAERHNQAINSLGLLSARQTMTAVELLSMIVANCLYTSCQGVDVRAMHRTFLVEFQTLARRFISSLKSEKPIALDLFDSFWKLFEEAWYETAALEIIERCDRASEWFIFTIVYSSDFTGHLIVAEVVACQRSLSALALDLYQIHRDKFFENQTTPEYLGQGTKVLYYFVRDHLDVPMHRGQVEHPGADDPTGNVIDGRPKRTIGSWVSLIYEAIRDGSLYDAMFHYLETTSMLGAESRCH
ncbi:hypothetical protein RRF57_002410 [Xylaria bambusicola]|uniref:Phenylalanine ammonia-lyase n=1 Tax=Xylaria bambusicola TaxID=326684 RepID=A0AAN7U6X1_9PEZI